MVPIFEQNFSITPYEYASYNLSSTGYPPSTIDLSKFIPLN